MSLLTPTGTVYAYRTLVIDCVPILHNFNTFAACFVLIVAAHSFSHVPCIPFRLFEPATSFWAIITHKGLICYLCREYFSFIYNVMAKSTQMLIVSSLSARSTLQCHAMQAIRAPAVCCRESLFIWGFYSWLLCVSIPPQAYAATQTVQENRVF